MQKRAYRYGDPVPDLLKL
ncbi:hypothetical protein MYX34_06640 [Borreliella burgdorferi]|nr:hypothetical protein [Borreliella burgdorferi]MCS2182396.1 hypothetical protein [Borreliella burgdorferi]